ncbi:MAG: fatty acid desaturase [Planctomycetes bacterium]|nr:fatty acid desaturase [Planctomycetota bacterium]
MSDDARDIPSGLNTALVLGVVSCQCLLLWTASHCDGGWMLAVVAVMFSLLFLTSYALMHEASHGALHRLSAFNWALGALAGATFPTSATMMRVTHAVHHRCNRTDHEMFDCYYLGDRVWLKRAQWYSILTGMFYLIIPVGAVLVGFLRPLLLTRVFKRTRSSSVLYDDFDGRTLWLVRLECLVVASAFVLLFSNDVLEPGPTVLLFALGGLHWSTRQYVTHAWSRRDVIHGAHNLTAGPLMRVVLLYGHWDLVHHQHPTSSWIELPRLGTTSVAPIVFWRQYLSLWRGPRPATEPSPKVLPDLSVAR